MKKFNLLLLVSIAFSISALCQSVSALESQLTEIKDSTQYLKILNELATAYYKTDLVKSLETSIKATSLSDRLDNKLEKSKAMLTYGDCLGKQTKSDEALSQYKQALVLAEDIKDDLQIASCNQKLGNQYLRMNNLSLAESYYKNVINIRKKNNDEKGLASVYNNLVILSEQKNDTEGALRYLKGSLDIRRKLGNPSDLSATLVRLGSFQLKTGQYEDAKSTLVEVLSLLDEKSDKRTYTNATNLLSTACIELGDFKNAKKWIDKSSILADELNDNQYKFNAQYNEATLYYYTGQYKKGVEINSKVIEHFEGLKTPDKLNYLQISYLLHFNLLGELGLKSAEEWYHKLMDTQPNEKIEAMIYLNFARYHSLIGNNDFFMTYARKSYQMGDKADRVTAAMSTAQVGIALQRQKKYEEASPYLLEGKKLLEKLNSNLEKTHILSAISEHQAALHKNYEQSIKTAEKALLIAQQNESLKEQEIAYASLAHAHEQSGNKAMALTYYRKKTALRDSLLRSDDYEAVLTTNEVLNIGSELKEAQTKAKVTNQNLEKEKKSKTHLTWIFILAGLLLTSLAAYIFRSQKQKSYIEKQNHALALAQSELQLMLEKKRISRDLHDDVGSALSSISILSYSALNELESQYQKQKIQIIGERAHEAMENIQDIVWACNPTNDTLGKIFQRLVRYSSETLEAQNIAFICENKKNDQLADQKISMEKRKDIYLAFKEIINNISKHSKASNVSLTIESIYNNLECTIKDDGISFDLTDQKNHHTGNGLQNIIARIESIDGKINTNRSENSNTIKISIPI
ncbi:MAG: tetratricopeptide repeat protein [Saprospiraceae bacterium]|nr:tetratricopeptide repeat protein [Saprospiraceae bacterium]